MSASINSVAFDVNLVDVPTVLIGAVDAYDAAARLEASGHGMSAALRAGYSSTFAQARALLPTETYVDAIQRTHDMRVHGGWARTLVLISGVALCLLLLPPDASPLQVFLAAGATWTVSQILSAVLWTGIGRGEIPTAARMAAMIALGSLACAAAVGALFGWAIVGWAAWGIVAAVGNSLYAGRRFASLCAIGAVVPLALSLWDPRLAAVVAAMVVATAFLWVMTAILRRAASGATPDHRLLTASGLAMLQSLALQAGLVGLYLIHRQSFGVIALSGFLLAVACETGLDYVAAFARSIAARTTSWRRARKRITLMAVVATAAGGIIGAAMCALAGYFLAAGTMPSSTYQAALILGVLVTAAGLLLRCGSSAGAAMISVVGSAMMLLIQVMGGSRLGVTASICLALAFCVGTAMVAAWHLSAPRNW